MTNVIKVITLAGQFFQKLHKSDLGTPMSDLIRRRKMKEKSKLNETIFHSSLIKTKYAEDYALTLQEIYSDITSVPHFNDEEVLLENWGIEFFFKDTKEQIEWTVIVALMAFINQTGCEVSYVLTNQKFKEFAIWQENICLGKKQIIISNEIETTTIEAEDEF